jgi:hypothetical protein
MAERDLLWVLHILITQLTSIAWALHQAGQHVLAHESGDVAEMLPALEMLYENLWIAQRLLAACREATPPGRDHASDDAPEA